MLLASIALALFGRGVTGRMRSLAQMLIAPLGDGGMYVVSALKSIDRGPTISPTEALALRHENEQLRLQLVEMEQRYAEQAGAHRHQLEQLQQIRSSAFVPRQDNPCELIHARVGAGDGLSYGNWRVLNRGGDGIAHSPVLSRMLITDRSKGIPPNLAVITSSALVGRIASSGAFTSKIQLVTDRGFAIRGRIVRLIDPEKPRLIMSNKPGEAGMVVLTDFNNRLEVLARGDGVSGLVIEDVPESERVLAGDWLVTSDDDLHLRTEVRIGVVEEVTVNPSDRRFTTVKVRPFADLSTLRDVYIVYWKPAI